MTAEHRVMVLSHADMDCVPGSVPITAGCGHRCWISPDGMRLLMAEQVETRCTECVDLSEVTEMHGVPGAFDTVEQLLGRGTSEHLRGLLAAYNAQRRKGRGRMNHEPCLYASTRHGCWCHCTCGQWSSGLYTTVTGAHIAFGTHLVEIVNRTK